MPEEFVSYRGIARTLADRLLAANPQESPYTPTDIQTWVEGLDDDYLSRIAFLLWLSGACAFIVHTHYFTEADAPIPASLD